jgi:hypothetical protein
MNYHQQRPARKASAVIALVFGLVFPTILHTGLYVDVAVARFVLVPVFLFGDLNVPRSLWSLAQSNFTLPPSPELSLLFSAAAIHSHDIRVLSRIMPVRR